ncbi:hypothetical protein [Nostoc sp. TCL240-02]|uniref:hypothetical protein n=1 Tax=Nostoc sp. TCL240-02 TaxID=2572090 RepID=UPI00157F86A1|nr:hypothetical protein [Nostoc sp. TCL240-02]QKQ73207.1 hypothetical protein FBB35_07335 [Nostoc sp. TCL240-02]
MVLLESWLGHTYAEIAEQISYKHDYIKQVGSQLWRSLSQVIGEEVCKKKYPICFASLPAVPKRWII